VDRYATAAAIVVLAAAAALIVWQVAVLVASGAVGVESLLWRWS
jgi:hypothetical protein